MQRYAQVLQGASPFHYIVGIGVDRAWNPEDNFALLDTCQVLRYCAAAESRVSSHEASLLPGREASSWASSDEV